MTAARDAIIRKAAKLAALAKHRDRVITCRIFMACRILYGNDTPWKQSPFARRLNPGARLKIRIPTRARLGWWLDWRTHHTGRTWAQKQDHKHRNHDLVYSAMSLLLAAEQLREESPHA